MQSYVRNAVGLILAFLLLPVTQSAWGQAPGKPPSATVGIICLDSSDTKGEVLEPVLTAEFTTSKEFRLVERQAVQKVLQEKTLQQFSDTAGAANAGRIIGADLLLMIQPMEKSSPPVARVRVVEVVSGIIMLDAIDELRGLVAKPEPLREAVEGIAKRAAVPVADRKFVGVLGIWSEEPGGVLDPVVAPLDTLLRNDLAQSPRIIVLEREQLQHLTAERNLAGTDLKLKASTILIDLTMKRSAKPESIDATLKLTRPGAASPQLLKLVLPANDLPALRKQLAAAILKALQVPAAPEVAGNVQAEAAAFARRAALLASYGNRKEACSLAEAAFALDPQRSYGQLAERCYADCAEDVNSPPLNRLKAARRGWEIGSDAMIAFANADDLQSIDKLGRRIGFDFLGYVMVFLPIPATNRSEEQKVLCDIIDMMRRELDAIAAAKRRANKSAYVILRQKVNPNLVADGPELLKVAKEAVEQWRTEVKSGVFNRSASPEFHEPLHYTMGLDQRGNLALQDFKPLYTWMTEQPEPWLQVSGWDLLSFYPGAEGQQAASKMLDLLYRGKISVDDWPAIQFQLCNGSRAHAVRRLWDDKKAGDYLSSVLDDIEKNGDGLELVRWQDITMFLAGSINNGNDTADLQLSKRMAKLIHLKPVPAACATNLKTLDSRLSKWIAAIQKRVDEKSGTARNDWNGFEGKELVLPAPADTEQMIWASLDRSADPSLLLVWRGKETNASAGKADQKLVVGRLSLSGAAMTELGHGVFTRTVGPGLGSYLHGYCISDAITTPDGTFLADYGNGVLVVRDGKITEWTEKQSLPSKRVWSLGYATGKLFVGMDGGFAELDAKTGAAKTLASSRSLTPANPLDGGQRYRVTRIIASPDGKSLWLAIGGHKERDGLWRYDLAAHTFEHTVKMTDEPLWSPDSGPSLNWNDDKLLLLGIAPGLYDPNSGKRLTTLRGYRDISQAPSTSFLDPDPIPGAGNTFDLGPAGSQFPGFKSTASYTTHRRMTLVGDKLVNAWGDLQTQSGEVFSAKKYPFEPKFSGRSWACVERVGTGFITVDCGTTKAPSAAWIVLPKEGK